MTDHQPWILKLQHCLFISVCPFCLCLSIYFSVCIFLSLFVSVCLCSYLFTSVSVCLSMFTVYPYLSVYLCDFFCLSLSAFVSPVSLCQSLIALFCLFSSFFAFFYSLYVCLFQSVSLSLCFSLCVSSCTLISNKSWKCCLLTVRLNLLVKQKSFGQPGNSYIIYSYWHKLRCCSQIH